MNKRIREIIKKMEWEKKVANGFPEGISIVLPNNRGKYWTSQTGGCACNHPMTRGDLILNLNTKEAIEISNRLAIENYCGYKGKKTVTEEKMIERLGLPLEKILFRSKMKKYVKTKMDEVKIIFSSCHGLAPSEVSHEAWMWCKVKDNKNDFWKKYVGKEVLVAYANSD